MRLMVGWLALVLAVAAPIAAQAEERITSFKSEVWIEPDASVLVRETIEVVAEGQDIKRGIYRDFPTDYRDRHGLRVRVAFDVQSVTRDGQPEDHFTEDYANGVRLYIGNADVLIAHGRHVYEITYRTDRQLGFYEDFDEFYWNATGNGWAFAIERATARVHLPAGAGAREAIAYTGRQGEQGTDFNVGLYSDDDVWFETTRPLQPGEGLTIAVSWPKGFVAAPTASDELWWFLRDNLVLGISLVGMLAIVVYYLYVWRRVGRDPESGTVYPRYEPPEGLSPAAARFVHRMGFDNKAFTAAVVSLAVKGFLKIEQDEDDKYTLVKISDTPQLSKGEAAVARKLFPGERGRIEMKQKNHGSIGGARTALQDALQREFEKSHFVHNRMYFVIGAILSVAAIGLMVLGSEAPLEGGFMGLWLSVWSIGVAVLLVRAWSAWKAVFATGGLSNFIVAIPTTLFAVPFLGAWFVGLGLFAYAVSYAGTALIVVLVAVNLLFYWLLKAPTRLGRALLDEIEGFKLFLTVTEKDRMNLLNPPDRTPELFERYLPYALALGVEQAWSEQFAGVLGAIGPHGERTGRGYRPAWYSGRRFDGNFGSMASSLGGGLSGAIASSSTAPGKSGGGGGGFSGGGGSSGGGGGGGGGGGW